MPSLGFIGNNIFHTGDQRLLDLFCTSDPGELVQVGASTWDHDSITREGLKRALVQFFTEFPGDDGFTPPSGDATLVEVFQ